MTSPDWADKAAREIGVLCDGDAEQGTDVCAASPCFAHHSIAAALRAAREQWFKEGYRDGWDDAFEEAMSTVDALNDEIKAREAR